MDPDRAKMPRLMIPGSGGATTISDLPDELLQKIVSDLPTKDAVHTSVLSKRWEHLWKDITKLDLQQDSFETRQQFIEFVERLLVLCTNASRLEKFSLAFNANNQTDRLNRWFHEFINPNIEELNLVLEKINEPLLVFPEHLFNSETLTKFQLSMPLVLNIPDNIYWRSLKFLILKHVIFPDGKSAQRLFSGCHVLEELTLIDCNWSNVRVACLACPLLRKLAIREWRDDLVVDDDDSGDDDDDAGDGNDNGPARCRIVIVGNENMTHFAYDGDMINEYFLYCTQSVVDASIEVHTPEDFQGDAGYFVFMLLRALPNVKRLSLTEDAADAVLKSMYPMVHIPLFNWLKVLHVASSFPVDLSSASLATILRNSPLLESIEFVMGVTMAAKYEEFSMDPLPGCISSNLKQITTCSFDGMEGELDAIKYLLRVAPLLERFDIYSNMYYFDQDLGPEQLDQLYYQIIQFPMASERCYLHLE